MPSNLPILKTLPPAFGLLRNGCLGLLAIIGMGLSGCQVQPPGGSPVQPIVLGSVVDEVNRIQEENAELAKLIVYVHEFEINMPLESKPSNETEVETATEGFKYITPEHVRGFRFTPYGQDHLWQIAQRLQQVIYNGEMPMGMESRYSVTVERSQTSKYWRTKHQYPVHFNDELDEVRRRMVVDALTAYGISNANQLVVIAPAFPEGLSGQEAANSYQRAFGAGMGMGGGMGGGGIGGFGGR
ncbi:MAG: hypothetical protein AB8B55_23865 [Mariniblastus sp.]